MCAVCRCACWHVGNLTTYQVYCMFYHTQNVGDIAGYLRILRFCGSFPTRLAAIHVKGRRERAPQLNSGAAITPPYASTACLDRGGANVLVKVASDPFYFIC